MTHGAIILTETQRSFLLSPAAKALKPSDAAGLKLHESFERFKDIRFGWTDGRPVCPHCNAEKPYELHRRGLTPTYRCRNHACQKDFSLTSGTPFSSRKASHKTLLRAIAMRLHEPRNALQTSYELGIAYKTAWRWARRFAVLVGNVRIHRVQDSRWPFANSDRTEATDLVTMVNGALPRGLPEQVRADVAQDLILGVLSGEMNEAQLETHVQKYIRRHYRTMEWRFDTKSLNQPVSGLEGRGWDDVLGSEREHF